MAGNCANGTMTITGVDTVTSKVLPSNLCGTLTGQHMYLSVANATTIKISIALSSVGSQNWRILVRQYENTQTSYLAPRGCLQYFRSVLVLYYPTSLSFCIYMFICLYTYVYTFHGKIQHGQLIPCNRLS
jgi:hypothetical protein